MVLEAVSIATGSIWETCWFTLLLQLLELDPGGETHKDTINWDIKHWYLFSKLAARMGDYFRGVLVFVGC